MFIVGFNPASQVLLDEEILNRESGFNLEKFYNKYRKLGRTRGPDFSNLKYHRNINPDLPCKLSATRASLECLSAAIENRLAEFGRPGVLETNIHWQATKNAREYRRNYGRTDEGKGIKFLVEELNPLVILCHGREAEQFFRAEENQILTAGRDLMVIGQEEAWLNKKGALSPKISHLSRFPRVMNDGEYVDAVADGVAAKYEARVKSRKGTA